MTTSATTPARRTRPALPGPLPIAAGAALGGLAGVLADAGTSAIAAGIAVGMVAVAAGVPDVRERRIPNLVVLAAAAAAAFIATAVALAGDTTVIASTVAGGAVGGGLLLALHLARPASLGFGDVKLAAGLGALVGSVHWVLIAIALGAAATLGAVGSMALRTWRRSIPFGTCLGAGALLALGSAAWWRDAGLW